VKVDCIYEDSRDCYFLTLDNFFEKKHLVTKLNIDEWHYDNIMIKHGATYTKGIYWFDTHENAMECVNELSPFIIMYSITKNN
jgi:hypothetical protein